MTKWERVEAALHGADVDRIPISLWKHYHLQDRAPGQLAEVTIALHRQFDTDLIKLTPSGLYPIQDWGATIRFGSDDDFLPLAVLPVISSAGDWEALPRLDVNKGALRRELETIHHVATALDGSAPFMMTLFSPLNIAYKLCGDRVSGELVVEYMRHAPRQLHAGLSLICDIVIEYAAACLEAGAPGIFFATQMATTDLMTREEFVEFGVAYDLRVLQDDRGAIPPYDAIILAGPRMVREHPDVIAALRQLTGTIDADHMRRMNRAVDENGDTPASVARDFLRGLKSP